MQFSFLQHVWRYITVLGVAVVLLYSLIYGYSAGGLKAQSSFAAAQAPEITKALNYFYNDFDRYPTTDEFFDQKIMATYFTAFPLVQIPGGSCSQTFAYRQLKSNAYQLGVCIAAALSGWQAGWNRFTESK